MYTSYQLFYNNKYMSLLTIQIACQFMHHAKRKRMTTDDFDKALKWSRVEVQCVLLLDHLYCILCSGCCILNCAMPFFSYPHSRPHSHSMVTRLGKPPPSVPHRIAACLLCRMTRLTSPPRPWLTHSS